MLGDLCLVGGALPMNWESTTVSVSPIEMPMARTLPA
jgi:hypothetical protein